ncbi:BamA/TamA family outer membrane protein [Daejeonella oryzae]|uniref:hypothetical protein n=1 Tax=Daejeonella oryzae TaxID=1122943 RepID=UPI0004167371|nr:hypothetical protein [Daejeonella oryzae]
MKKPLLSLIILFTIALFTPFSVFAQKKLIKKLFSNEKDTTRSSSFIPLPAVGYSQETGLEFGALTLYSFYSDRQDTLTRNSSVTGMATYTTQKQVNLKLQTDYWTPQNRYHYFNEIRYKNFPFNFYGTGPQTRESDELKVTQKLFRVIAEAEKKTGKVSYTGINASFEKHDYDFGDEPTNSSNPLLLLRGKNGGQVLFAGISQILDSRNSNTYSSSGTYLKLNYSYAPAVFGDQNFEGSFTKLDFRTFKSLGNQLILGVNANYQTIQGSNTPFYLLPQLGNDQMMRGYYTGRFRDQNLMALQAEIRYRFIPRFALVGFAGGGTVYSNGNLNFANLKPSLGGGFRYFFDVERGLSIRMDYGIGEKRAGESRQTGFYLSLGEAF